MTDDRPSHLAPADRELRLWRLGRALAVIFVFAVLVAGGVFFGLVLLLDFQEIDTAAKLDAKTLFDLVKLSFGVVTGAGTAQCRSMSKARACTSTPLMSSAPSSATVRRSASTGTPVRQPPRPTSTRRKKESFVSAGMTKFSTTSWKITKWFPDGTWLCAVSKESSGNPCVKVHR
ncbi:hypothetical protein ACIPK5_30815 [Streptomyces sp. NPDC086843]|uniref:hypothetical protein n=1 Tax=Streptomyces sp. NPDC086843 TaxID=3365763 RepID=UPI003827AA21